MDEIDKDLLGFYWDYFEGEKVRNVREGRKWWDVIGERLNVLEKSLKIIAVIFRCKKSLIELLKSSKVVQIFVRFFKNNFFTVLKFSNFW